MARTPPIPLPRNQMPPRPRPLGEGGDAPTEGEEEAQPCALVGVMLACGKCGAIGVMAPGAPLFCRCGRVFLPTGDMVCPMRILDGDSLIQGLADSERKKKEAAPPAPALPPLPDPEALVLPPTGLYLPPGVRRPS